MLKPTFRSSFDNLVEKPFYIAELRISSALQIRSPSDFAKNANANCGMWAKITNSTVGTSSKILITPLDTDASCVTFKAVANAAGGDFTVTCVAGPTPTF